MRMALWPVRMMVTDGTGGVLIGVSVVPASRTPKMCRLGLEALERGQKMGDLIKEDAL